MEKSIAFNPTNRDRPDLFSAAIYYEPDVDGLIDDVAGSGRAISQFCQSLSPAFAEVENGRPGEVAMSFIDGVFQLAPGGAYFEPDYSRLIWLEISNTLPAFLSAPAGNVATRKGLGKLTCRLSW